MSYEKYGSYELLKRLATGGMAQIYLARQLGMEGFEKLLVVKRILPHLAENEDFVRMFLDEARLAVRLNHPNIVQILNLGAEGHSYFIAMEYIHGKDVRRVWKNWKEQERRPIPIAAACRIIMEACGGLDYAHKKTDANGKPLGIVHRDISPQNLLVTFEGGVKIVDFGIAKAADQSSVTRSGVLKGKYSYMSPEQAAGKRIDARSDIFSLGIVLYELLTGTRLFKKPNDIQTLNAVTDCKVAPPSEMNPELPRDLDRVVLKALTKNPSERYQEAVEFQAAIESWLIERQLPASSAHLATFMEHLYPGQRELIGESLVDEAESDGKRDEDRAARRIPPAEGRGAEGGGGRSRLAETRVGRESGGKLRPHAEPRIIDARRNEKAPIAVPEQLALSAHPTTDPENSTTDKDDTVRPPRHYRGAVLWALAASLLVLAGWGVVSAMRKAPRPKPFAVLRLNSEPEGAAVVFNGVPLTTLTPCTLPPVPAGSYSLVVTREGYADYRTTLDVPKTGIIDIPKIALAPSGRPEKAAPDAGVRIPTPPVAIVLRTQPPGAEVWVNGLFEGKTPRVLSMLPGSTFLLKLRLSGYREVERSLDVGERPMQVEVFTLERTAPGTAQGSGPSTGIPGPSSTIARRPGGSATVPAGRPANDGGDAPAEEARSGGVGTVRFAVTPWAHVHCGDYDFGATPFPDQKMSAGTYDCTFRNPNLGVVQRRLEVRANNLAIVSVKFN